MLECEFIKQGNNNSVYTKIKCVQSINNKKEILWTEFIEDRFTCFWNIKKYF